MEETGKIDEAEAARILHKVLLGLNHVHSLGIIHRDLKPENIMMTNDGDPKLIDFGLSKQRSTNKKLSTIVGTPFYVAPEVLSGDYDFECDNWSLGVIMHVLVSGYLPFYG